MSITIDDIYTELISHFGLVEQLKFKCTNSFHLTQIKYHSLDEYFDYMKNHAHTMINNSVQLLSLSDVGKNKDLLDSFFLNVCRYGYLNLAKYLYNLGADYRICDYISFELICSDGHIKIAKWLYQLNSDIDIKKYFIMVCKEGQIEIAKWLYQLDSSVKINITDGFRLACMNGHIEIAKWLYQINSNVNIANIFIMVCKNGHLEVAKWLHQLGVDIHSNNEYALKCAVKNDHFDIIKWLYQLGANIRVNNDTIFNDLMSDYILGRISRKTIYWLENIYSSDINLTKKKINNIVMCVFDTFCLKYE